MSIRTPQEYIESLRDNRTVYFHGEKIKDVTKHPILKICRNWMAMDYVLQQDPKYQDLVTTKNEEGELVSFIFTPQKSKQDLMRLREVVQLQARVGFGKPSGAKFVGKDGMNALTVVTPRIDKKFGTDYAKRFENYRKYLQKTDAAIALCMTDVKGDRSLRPSQQKDHQDYYVHIVEENKDGIVVRGAKTHISQAPLSNEILVVPCRAMGEGDKDYAVSFGIPVDTKGLIHICADHEVHEPNNDFDYPIGSSIYINDGTIIFDDVFVPNERIFMKREWQFSGSIAHMFANFHRLSSETVKAIELELFAGIGALIAEYNGVEKVSHVREKLTWLTMYAEATEIIGRAACEHCVSEPDSDLVYPNPMYANIAKFYFADNWHQATKYMHDIAGGIVATAPSSKDFQNPETHDYMDKYFRGKNGVSAEHRLRLSKLIKDITSAYEDVLTIHAEGSLEMQKLAIFALADFNRYKASAKRAARINDGTKHPLFDELPEFPPMLD